MFQVIEIIKSVGIRTEIVLNTRLSNSQVETAINYIVENNIVPDEIACRNEHLLALRSAFPKTEFISCYNNGTEKVLDEFDSVVLGQKYLRDQGKRYRWLEKGYQLILLLNNGCSFLCNPMYCNQGHCEEMYGISRKKLSASQVYALQSFFPEELRALAITDPYFFSYRFKLSTRPLGLQYTRSVLNAYATMLKADRTLLDNDNTNYLLFGALTMLARNFSEMNYDDIMAYKNTLYPIKNS